MCMIAIVFVVSFASYQFVRRALGLYASHKTTRGDFVVVPTVSDLGQREVAE